MELHPAMIGSESETLENTSWTAHARSSTINSVICPTGLFPLLFQSANKVAMINHSFLMYSVCSFTSHDWADFNDHI